MSNKIITVENLGKMYRINRQGGGSYQTIRDRILSIPSRLKGINTNREEFWALKDVSFEIEAGDRVGIIGRNGAGKSTLLKLLGRITKPTKGRAVINGRVASLLEVGTGFHPELTGRENIFMNGALLGMTRSEIKCKFDEIVDFAEVEKFIDTPVKRYSSGMYVRLAFAVAAHLEPEILLVDEVLAVGDAQFQKKCLGKMEDVSKSEGRTILFVSHNMGAIRSLCTKTIMLKNGILHNFGDTEDIIKAYFRDNIESGNRFKQEHKESKAINLLRVILNPDKQQSLMEVLYDEPIKIRIEYEVNVEISNCFIWMGLQTIEGMYVLVTVDYDLNPDMLCRREKGIYHTDVIIPAKWLNTGEYCVNVGIVKKVPLEIFDQHEVFRFTVADPGTTPVSLFNESMRRGVLQPFLPWENVKH